VQMVWENKAGSRARAPERGLGTGVQSQSPSTGSGGWESRARAPVWGLGDGVRSQTPSTGSGDGGPEPEPQYGDWGTGSRARPPVRGLRDEVKQKLKGFCNLRVKFVTFCDNKIRYC